jgi:NO-binding membrane sensor protein with MHYT domain
VAVVLWLSLFVLLGSGWFLRSLSRRASSLSHRQNVRLIIVDAVWVGLVIALMMWIGVSKADVVGPLFVPVAVSISVVVAFSDDLGRLVRRAKRSKKRD